MSRARLSWEEREEIALEIALGRSLTGIAQDIGHPASTEARQVARNGVRRRYRAAVAGVRCAGGRAGQGSAVARSIVERLLRFVTPLRRLQTGCASSIPMSETGGCPTRRSTQRATCRAVATCGRSRPMRCAPAGLADVARAQPRP